MSDLGDLLESLHQASRRFDRARIVWRTWHHDERASAAFAAELEEMGARPLATLDADAEPLPPERTGRIRIWFERPDRWREEREGESIGADLGLHLDPAPAIGLYDFEPLGPGQRAGHNVINARATPRSQEVSQDIGVTLGAGADELLLEVDAEKGVLLRVESRRGGEPFSLFEAEEVAFDTPHPPTTFAYEPPPGEELHTWELHELPLHEAARRAPFPVFVPTHVPEDWGLAVSFTAPHDRPAVAAQVHLWYRAGGGVAAVNVIEEANGHARTPDAADWHDETLDDGTPLRVRDRTDDLPQAQLMTTRAGTAISMHSTELDADALVDLAASLRPAPTEPPELGRTDS